MSHSPAKADECMRSALLAASRTGGDLRQRVAAFLDDLATTSGDQMVRHTSRIVRAEARPGRPPTDDADALAEISEIIDRGGQPWVAIKAVAAALGGNVTAHEHRLRRKIRGSRT